MSLTFPFITGGTVSVAPGSTELTGDSTSFLLYSVLSGDVIFILGEDTHPVPIGADATDNAALTLGLAWAGAEQIDAPYFIMRAVDAERVMGAAREMIAISQGKFTEFEGVVDEATATVIAARDAAIAAKVIAEEAKETAELAAGGSTAALTAAEAAATAAAASEMASASSETNSAAYETAAETAATISLGAQGAAETAQSGAEAARDDAVAAKTAAELAETNAEAAQALSEGARDDALTAQTAAEAAKDAAETAKTNAVTAQVAAELARDGSMDAQTAAETAQALTESARDAALAGWDQFDDKYLGAKSSDPSLDNDSNALVDGAVYWNTTTKEWRTFDASTTTWFAFAGAGNASTIPTVPAGGLSSTNVQDALNELDTEKASAHNPVFTGTATGLDKAMVGLSNADNTSDLSKPISTATQTALDAKANASALTSHTDNTSNPHSVTKAQVGLGNVDNTADASKSVSYATNAGYATSAGSVPTSTIVTRGSNANGEYVRFADGTQICWATVTGGAALRTWTFPAAFSYSVGASATALRTASTTARIAIIRTLSTGALDTAVFDTSFNLTADPILCTAFGRWY